jgi:hypothetical protein
MFVIPRPCAIIKNGRHRYILNNPTKGLAMADNEEVTPETAAARQPQNLQVSAELYRAYQRCTWVIINETGRSQVEIMEEMVRDFLIKHGC